MPFVTSTSGSNGSSLRYTRVKLRLALSPSANNPVPLAVIPFHGRSVIEPAVSGPAGQTSPAPRRFPRAVDRLPRAVVEVKTRPRAGCDAEQSVQRLRAVMAGADGDAEPVVEHLGEFVGVDSLEGETHQAGAMLGGGAEDAQALDLAQALVGVFDECLLVAMDRVETDGLQIVDGRRHGDGRDDGRRAGFELGGQLGRGEAVEPHFVDHAAAAQERRHRVEQRFFAVEDADARRAEHLVAAERQEVGVPGRRRRSSCAARSGRHRPARVRRRRGPWR